MKNFEALMKHFTTCIEFSLSNELFTLQIDTQQQIERKKDYLIASMNCILYSIVVEFVHFRLSKITLDKKKFLCIFPEKPKEICSKIAIKCDSLKA